MPIAAQMAFAVDYNAGVNVGQFAKYNITYESDTPNDPTTIDDRPAWFTMEIMSISANNVTIRLSTQGNDGSTPEGSGKLYICDIESGTINGLYYSGGLMGINPRFLLMAANMAYSSAGQQLFERDPFANLTFEKSETRTYLGNSRTVNVFTDSQSSSYTSSNETTTWTNENTITQTSVYDKSSGIPLEAIWESKETKPNTALNLRVTTKITDTNIFEVTNSNTQAPPTPTVPELNYYTAAILVILATTVILVSLKRKVKPKPKT